MFIYRVNQSIQIAERAGAAGTRSVQGISSRDRSPRGCQPPTISPLLVQRAPPITLNNASLVIQYYFSYNRLYNGIVKT